MKPKALLGEFRQATFVNDVAASRRTYSIFETPKFYIVELHELRFLAIEVVVDGVDVADGCFVEQRIGRKDMLHFSHVLLVRHRREVAEEEQIELGRTMVGAPPGERRQDGDNRQQQR